MRSPPLLARLATLLALAVLAAPAWADDPPLPPPDDECGGEVASWAKRASSAAGREIKAVACPAGLVRLAVADAGCDYEVARGKGFQKTTDGAFGVSPIVNLDWEKAPEGMKLGLAAVLAALAADSSLPIRAGDAVLRKEASAIASGRAVVIGIGAAAVAAAAVGFGLRWRLRKRRRAVQASNVAEKPSNAP